MPSLLLINPNTSASVSATLQSHAQRIAGDPTRVQVVTARFGAPYIACEASYAVAAHAALDAFACAVGAPTGGAVAASAQFDAVLIGCFGDPGLMALQQCAAMPVTGLAQASFVQASGLGRFAIVTGGARWKPMLERLAQNLGFESQLAGIHTLEQSGAELARDPQASQGLLLQACAQAVQRFGVDALILGGAGLAGMAQAIGPELGIPVIDSVSAGVCHALALAALAPPGVADSGQGRVFDFSWKGVSSELTALGAA